jgi:hypothetical protein
MDPRAWSLASMAYYLTSSALRLGKRGVGVGGESVRVRVRARKKERERSFELFRSHSHSRSFFSTRSRDRTGTASLPLVFETSASTNSAIRAFLLSCRPYKSCRS